MIYIIREYKKKYKEQGLTGKDLTDHCIIQCVRAYREKKGMDLNGFDDRIVRNEEGKPFLVSKRDQIHISVSHSEDLFACVVEEYEVGIDLEFIRNVKYQSISKRYFSQAENQVVEELGLKGFLNIWVRKEAYAKYTGHGLKDVLGKIDVFALKEVSFLEIPLGDEIIGALCLPGEQTLKDNRKTAESTEL